MVELAVQGLLVVLLLLTVTWCIIVHYRLRRLRTDRGEMEAFIAALGEATGRAEAAVQQMREANAAVEGTAREQEQRARRQTSELARLMDNAVRVVRRLDAAIEQGATQVAELRTPTATTSEALRSAPPPETPRAARRHPPEQQRSAPEPKRSAPPRSPAVAAPHRREQSVRPVGREGQLDGLLHGELLEALQGLR